MIVNAAVTLGIDDDGRMSTTTQLQIEEEINEWTRRSREEYAV